MLLRYPITSFGSHHVELTGGLLTRFEDFIIEKMNAFVENRKLRAELSIMTEREMQDLGLSRYDLALIADGKYVASQDARR